MTWSSSRMAISWPGTEISPAGEDGKRNLAHRRLESRGSVRLCCHAQTAVHPTPPQTRKRPCPNHSQTCAAISRPPTGSSPTRASSMPSATSACAIRTIRIDISSRARAHPALVQPNDILEYDLDSNPIIPPKERPYSERVIHGEIFKARPGRECRVPSPRALDHAVRDRRRAAGAGVSPRRRDGRRARRSGIAATNSATRTCWW